VWKFLYPILYGNVHGEIRTPLCCVQGFPSVGDVHSTIPVPKEKWFEYAGERSGRFQVTLFLTVARFLD